ncbi:hypothetical protein [Roseiflexus castenholzii]|uniref:Uncharacterized protein n=1 Tax=Roseiflexus castenholzii (strain DSM 13941 / HLO8) TaxID=383372 RepID=A7NJC9_ROSCS|nr:hypothetical protein [Roseiflexus castenholzii]ABU57599.1 conserved hypothetical protein [Roseiflexus castenholzii DSM 13941]
MISRTWIWFIGALAVTALVFIAPNVNAQQAPGACPFGGVCPTGTPLMLRSGGGTPMQGRDGGLIGVAADTLGMTRQALLSELYGGKTIADVALAQGVDPLTIVDAFVSPQFARIDALVARGVITQKQADDARESMRTHITVLVSSPIESWVRQAHDPLIGQRPSTAGQGPATQSGGRGPRWQR